MLARAGLDLDWFRVEILPTFYSWKEANCVGTHTHSNWEIRENTFCCCFSAQKIVEKHWKHRGRLLAFLQIEFLLYFEGSVQNCWTDNWENFGVENFIWDFHSNTKHKSWNIWLEKMQEAFWGRMYVMTFNIWNSNFCRGFENKARTLLQLGFAQSSYFVLKLFEL